MSAKRLTRPTHDRVFLGVCSGLAEYFGVDPIIVRLLFVLAIFAAGTSPLIYLLLAIVMPNAAALPAGQASLPPAASTKDTPSSLGDDVVRTVKGAIDNATEDPDSSAASF